MKILIVGGGIAGLFLAGLCEKLEIEYRLIEKQPDQSHHGYLIGLWSNARKMLEKLDLANNLDREGKVVKFFKIRNGSGKLLREYDLKYFSINYGGYMMIERSKLIDWLSSKVAEDKITFGLTIKSLEQKKESVRVCFSDGVEEEYDLVVGADGVSSQVRCLAFSEKEYRKFSNWRIWYAWINEIDTEAYTATSYTEPNEYVITFNAGGKSLACFMTHVDHNIWDKEDGRIERLKELFKEESVLIPSTLNVQRSGEILPTDLSEIKMKSLYKGRIVLIGDSAHGFEPFAGIGSSMAMEDAYVLATELLKNKDINDALKTHQSKRKKRVKIARRLTIRMQSLVAVRSKFMRKLLDLFIPYLPESIFLKDYKMLLSEDL